MLTRYATLSLLLASCLVQPANSGDADPELHTLVAELEHLLTSPPPPSLAHYRRLFGAGDESERFLEQAECTKRELDPPTCLRWRRSRWQNPDSEPSLLLRLLRERLGMVGSLQVVQAHSHDSDPAALPYQLIEATFGTHRLELYRPLRDQGRFGWLHVGKIDGSPLVDIVVAP